MNFIATIADTLYGWILDANAGDYGVIINNNVLSWILILLFIVTIASTCWFYFGVAKVAANATKKNYLIVLLLGLFVLVLANFVIVPTIVNDWSYVFETNNILLFLIDCVYYVILYEIISWLIKDYSNAKHIHLINCF